MIAEIWTNTELNFILELVVACAVLTRPLQKKGRFPVRLALSMLGSLVFWWLMILLTPLGDWMDILNGRLWEQSAAYIICFLGVSLPIFLICCQTDLLNAISYAACAYAMQHIVYVAMVLVYVITGRMADYLVEIFVMAAVYAAVHFLMLRFLPRHDRMERGRGASLISSVLIVFAVVVLSLATNPQFHESAVMFIIGQVYSFICCLFYLWVQVSYRRDSAAQHENDVISVRTSEWRRKKDFETAAYRNMTSMSKELREMLAENLRDGKEAVLQEFDNIVSRYRGEVSPHSEILNVILREKKLRTEGKVEWTCACDTQKLGFLDVNDVYTIFGNALDNAIECVMRYGEPEKRMVDVLVYPRKALLNIRVDNYCDEELQFDGELPVTTKDDLFCGYGLELIRGAIEKYDGEMRVNYENHMFSLQVVIPIPEEK